MEEIVLAIKNGKYIKKFLVEIENLSLLHIGANDGQLLLDSEENKAIIPATSIAGAFKAFLSEDSENEIVKDMFGQREELSKIFFYDSFADLNGIEIRPAVSIDAATGTNDNKFERIYIGEGQKFSLYIEIYADDKESIKEYSTNIYRCLIAVEYGNIRFGSYKNTGAGLFKINSISEKDYNLNESKELISYLKDLKEYTNVSIENIKKQVNIGDRYVTFELYGSISTPLLIKGYSTLDYEKADDEQLLNSKGKAVIPGTSLKGIIRSQGEKILNYFNKQNQIEDIFGVSSSNKERKAISNIITFDTVIEKHKTTHYNKIKIDRFTGAVMPGALISDEPIVGDLSIKVKYKKGSDQNVNNLAIGLLTLIFRDIAISNLSIGSGNNIGRGRIQGRKITVTEGNEKVFVWDVMENKIEINKIDSHIKYVSEMGEKVNVR